MYIAECVSSGSKLVIAQHGGRVTNLKTLPLFDHEIDISDYYLTWGLKKKKKNKKIKNIGITKSIEIIKRSSKENILFIMLSKGRFTRNADSELRNIKDTYYYYSKLCPNFYQLLNKNLKSKLIYRSGKFNYWNEKGLLVKNCKLAKIDFERNSSLSNYVKKSRIIVCSYLSTTFI